MNDNKWTENIILADGDYIDRVAFDLTVNFERMLGRRIPAADLARWAECVALDGGLREGENETSIVIVHNQHSNKLQNFMPADYATELNGKAFQGRLGEFSITAVQTEEMAGKDDLLRDMLQMMCTQEEVKRLMIVVPEPTADQLRPLLKRLDRESRHTTLFTMQPIAGGAYRQEILGYSLMAALGISGREIEEKLNK